MNVTQLLREALAVLKEGGWVQGSYRTEDGRHCAVGAIERVLDNSTNDGVVPWDVNLYNRAVELLDEVAREKDPDRADTISFNDTPGRTFAEVADAFKTAIARAKSA